MRLWARMIPQSTVLCADSFFGSHGLAKEFAAQRRPFLMLSKRDKQDAGLTRAAALTQEGDMARAIVANKNYELAVYKNPKVGHKPPRLVPFLTNCWYGEEVPKDRRGNPLPPVVACHREFSRAVDGAKQMALQMRQLGRQMTWSHAVRVFMVRYAAGNAFATAKASGLVDDKTTMWEFQWDMLKQRYFSGAEFNSTTPTAAVPTLCEPPLVHASPQREYALGVWSVREAHAHQVLQGRPRRVVCHGRGGADRDGHGGGASAIRTHGTSANPGGTTT